MSKAPSANKNLELARSVRQQGFNSLIDAQPELKTFVDQQLAAKISPKLIRIEAQSKFPKLHVPSMPSFYAYAKKRLADSQRTITVDAGTEKYFDMIGRFDVLEKMYSVAKDMEQEIDDAITRGTRTDTVRKLRASYGDYLIKITDKEIQLGLRQKVIEQFKASDAGGNTVNGQNIEVTKEDVDELVNDLDKLFANRERLARWSATKQLSPEQSIAVGAVKM